MTYREAERRSTSVPSACTANSSRNHMTSSVCAVVLYPARTVGYGIRVALREFWTTSTRQMRAPRHAVESTR
eukprot:scaffold471187_cov19-Prasinocladus_malaysianus.AAC.1